MTLLVMALVAFAAVHLVPAIPRAKAAAKGRLGRAYGPAYSMASLLLVVAVIAAFRQADVVPLYDVPSWGAHANFVLTLVAFIFVGIFLFRGSWRNRLGYPMAIATVIWAAGHLLANGDSRTTVFFLGFAAIALLQAFLSSRLVERVRSEERGGHNLLSILFGVALYGIVAQIHGAVIGVPVVTLVGL